MKKQIVLSVCFSFATYIAAFAQNEVAPATAPQKAPDAMEKKEKPAKTDKATGLERADQQTAGKPGKGNESVKKAAQKKKAKTQGNQKPKKNTGAPKAKPAQSGQPKQGQKAPETQPDVKQKGTQPSNDGAKPADKASQKGKVNTGFTNGGK